MGSVTLRLCVMMFIQFFIWGVWYVPMFPYLSELGIAPVRIGIAYSFTGVAAMISPFIVGMIADRFFPSQRVLGVLHLMGGVFLFLAAGATDWAGFWPLLLLHLLCYMPTLALVNSVSFQNMADPQRQFPPVRTLGTIGWIVSGVVVGSSFLAAGGGYALQWPQFLGGPPAPDTWTGLGVTKWPFYIGSGASILLGLYSFVLPHTPPKLKGENVGVGDILGLKALKLMRDPSFAVFIICSLLICIPLSFYFQSANGFLKAMDVNNSEGVMTLGQVSEIFFLLLVPFFFRKFGVKLMLIIGMFSWILRYVLFANASPGAYTFLFLGVLLHGICYDFFFVTGQLYVDQRAPRDIRSSAQGFIAFVTLGVGMFIGGLMNGWWNEKQTAADGTVNWPWIWYFPALMAAAVLIVFTLVFSERPKKIPA